MGIELPQGARVSADMCRRFIDVLKAAQWGERFKAEPRVQMPGSARPNMGSHGQLVDGPPTQKQLAYAEALASEARKEVPQSVRRSFRQCSMFIDDVKATRGWQAQSTHAWKAGSRW
jgi:hypothetical protein